MAHQGELDEAFAIERLIARFANSFDVKNWAALRDCLASELNTDYSDLRGSPPERMTRDRFVELRREALQELRTHHLTGNVEIEVAGATAVATVSTVIYRRHDGGRTFDTHCLYRFGLNRDPNGWTIASIVQKVLFNDGAPAVHRGIPTGD